jgi:biopolymer transport protein ExbB/biopolymer transport protein TolQ
MEAVKRSMECSISRTHQELKRGLNALATIGSTAPFVGLFGTVIGIMHTFGQGGSGTPDAWLSWRAGGIAEALVTTSLGLLVAVPAVWAFNYFSTKLEAFDLEMNYSLDAISTYLSGFQTVNRNH